MSAGLVIVGGSYAAVQIAASARQHGYAEPIRIVSEDRDPPYQRPPLSKGFLTGEIAEALLPMRAPKFYADNAISLELQVRVVALERTRRSILTAQGVRIPYARLALATGAHPRTLPVDGTELDGVHFLRSLADARALKERLALAQTVAVIGGGFIGLEVASICAKLGKRVAVIEAQPRLMSRALPTFLAEWLARLHRRHGVALHLGAGVSALRGERGRMRSVALKDGSAIAADLSIIAIGVAPNQEFARVAGLSCQDGIVVDRLARTSDPDIVAAGDCTRHPSSYCNALLRLESVQNAVDQARVAGATIAGKETPYDAVPWFWSEQYDAKLQMAGLSAGHDAYAVRGRPEDGKFSVYYLRAGRLIAADSLGRPADHVLARKLAAARAACTPEQAADESFDLKSLI